MQGLFYLHRWALVCYSLIIGLKQFVSGRESNVEKVLVDIKKFLANLEILVNIDSGSRHIEGTTKVGKFFTEKFSMLGWNVKSYNFAEDIGPCWEISNTDKGHYDILLALHIDTVFPVGTAAQRPFFIKGDRAYGPGVADMKAACLMTYQALKVLEDEKRLQGINICLAINSEEEIGSKRARSWLEHLAQNSRFVFVLEGARANGDLVLKRKGVGRYDIEFTGLAAHAGVEPEKGINAINELGYWIVELHKLTDFAVGTTINVGVVSGGTNANVVPNQAHAAVDFRFADPSEADRIKTVINNMLTNPYTPGVKIKVTGGVSRLPMNPNEKTEKLCHVIEKIGDELGIAIKWAHTGGGSDGNFSAALGIPTIDGLGPIGGGAHSINEYLTISSIQPRLNLLCEAIIGAAALHD
jgi:glutamate carboxypeptidase